MTTQPPVAGVWAGPRSPIIQTQNIPSREPAVAYLFTANISPKKQEPQSPRSIKYIIVYILWHGSLLCLPCISTDGNPDGEAPLESVCPRVWTESYRHHGSQSQHLLIRTRGARPSPPHHGDDDPFFALFRSFLPQWPSFAPSRDRCARGRHGASAAHDKRHNQQTAARWTGYPGATATKILFHPPSNSLWDGNVGSRLSRPPSVRMFRAAEIKFIPNPPPPTSTRWMKGNYLRDRYTLSKSCLRPAW